MTATRRTIHRVLRSAWPLLVAASDAIDSPKPEAGLVALAELAALIGRALADTPRPSMLSHAGRVHAKAASTGGGLGRISRTMMSEKGGKS